MTGTKQIELKTQDYTWREHSFDNVRVYKRLSPMKSPNKSEQWANTNYNLTAQQYTYTYMYTLCY